MPPRPSPPEMDRAHKAGIVISTCSHPLPSDISPRCPDAWRVPSPWPEAVPLPLPAANHRECEAISINEELLRQGRARKSLAPHSTRTISAGGFTLGSCVYGTCARKDSASSSTLSLASWASFAALSAQEARSDASSRRSASCSMSDLALRSDVIA